MTQLKGTKGKLLALALLIIGPGAFGQKIDVPEGPININYLEYYGLSPELIQTAIFPLSQKQVKFDGKIAVHTPKTLDTVRLVMNYDPFYDLGLDVKVAPEGSEPFKTIKKREVKKLLAANLDKFKKNKGRTFIDSDGFQLVDRTDGGRTVKLKYSFDRSKLPFEYRYLRKYDLMAYLEDQVLKKIEVRLREPETPDEKRKFKIPKKEIISTTQYRALKGHEGYVITRHEETTIDRRWGKKSVTHANSEYYNFRDQHGENLYPSKQAEVAELNREDKNTARVRLERNLPLLGRAAMKAGYELPLPFGVEAFVHWQKESMQITSVNINSEELTNLIKPEESDVETVVTLTSGKFDFWVLPFLNVSVMGGNTIVNTDVRLTLSEEMQEILGFIDPDTTISQVRVAGPINSPFIGVGATLAWGYKNLFMTVNTMYIWARAVEANATTEALAVTPVLGYRNRIINIMAGVQYQLYDQNVRGNIILEGENLNFDVGLKSQRTNFILGLQKDLSRHWNATLLVGFKPREQVVLNVGYRF